MDDGKGPARGRIVTRALGTRRARGRVGSTPTLPTQTQTGKLQTEAQFQASIIDAARIRGYKVWHNTYALGSDKGWPDLVLVRPAWKARAGRLIFAELKGPRGVLAPEQAIWLETLRAAGQEAYLWDVREISLTEIAEILR